MPAQSLSCPRPSFAFRSPSIARLLDGAAQASECPCQTRFDRSGLDAQALGDVLYRHSGEAMEDEDIPMAAREPPDRPKKNLALAVIVVQLRWRQTH